MKGSYLIKIDLEKNKVISIGKLGKINLTKGEYIYVGSALNGIEQRLNRHLRKKKKKHWHIDYLLEHANIIDIFYKENEKKEECLIASKLNKKLLSIPGFGSSDCKCKSHLYYGSKDKIKNSIDNLEIKQYLF